MPRHFLIEEAERLLPGLERAIVEIVLHKKAFDEIGEELSAASRHIAMAGGTLVNREALSAKRQRAEELAGTIGAAIEAIQESGCVIKDLDQGLVDFPALFRGEEICLCWKLGERAIEHWHGAEAGFSGRKPIDEEFRAAYGT